MEAHTVFGPSMSADQRAQAWLDTVADVNKWNKQNPRKGGRFPTRTVDGCDNKWRKKLYGAIRAGESASKIASGPTEDDDALMATCQTLKDQWDQQVRDETVKREAKKKAKNPDLAKAINARDKATNSLSYSKTAPPSSTTDASSSKTPLPPSDPSAPDAEQEGTGGDGGGELGGSDKGKSTTRLRTRKSDASSAELTAAVAAMSSRQLAAADKAREQQQQQHDETLRLADKARALQRQEHRERLAREDRRLGLEERALKGKEKQEDRFSSLEDEVKQLGAAVTEAGNTSKQVLDYLKDKLQ
ncbi:hypothetical protein A4X06_0g9267 [Tilletia controversa]|uniref:Uncharacterized protein n=3 Tax=Tilletia TaxID=13289 RepID=A0A8X7MIY5_9BASI|nr:hypothetical protein A4X06_0g9267 [Tilletia controversa]